MVWGITQLIMISLLLGGSWAGAKAPAPNFWLLGFEKQVENAIGLARAGLVAPNEISDSALELAINDLEFVGERIEGQLDSCLDSQKPNYCSKETSSKKGFEYFRRKILAKRAQITFFRNLLIEEFNKSPAIRNFNNALRIGLKIKS